MFETAFKIEKRKEKEHARFPKGNNNRCNNNMDKKKKK